jgi:hypothetical protein
MPSLRHHELLTSPRPRPYIPPSVERLVAHAAREVQLLAALTPKGAHGERARLEADLHAGRRPSPRWTYAHVSHDELRRALDAAERALSASDDGPLHALYLARVRELSIEAALCAAAGTSDVACLARRRFGPSDNGMETAASALCAAWLAEPVHAVAGAGVVSDDPDPRSLLSQMRDAVGRLRLPFAVIALRSLAPLAATGERAILVAAGRLVYEEDAVRTVLHEVEGHARPRARSRDAELLLVRVGTARGVDDQEGYALLLEERAGMLGPRRRRQLAARHRAVEAMVAGASFADVASMLVDVHGLDVIDAVVIAERAFRGGNGAHPGLGRERVYIESFLRVRAHLAAHPADETFMASGQVAVDAIGALREWTDARQDDTPGSRGYRLPAG